MFCPRKQQPHSATLKLPVAALLSLLASFPEPTVAAIIRVVTEPISANNLESSYGGLNQADLFGLAFETDSGKLAARGTVLLAGNPSGDRSPDPLSLESLINSLSQLRLNGRGQQNEKTPPVPTLTQEVDMAKIYEGVYIFTPKNPPKTDADAPAQQNQSPAGAANSPSVGASGLYLPRLAGPSPALSLPQLVGLRLSSLPVGNTSSDNLLDPKKELATVPIDQSGKVRDFLKTLDRFGGLSIKVDLSLQPKTAIVNPLNLQVGYSLPSSLQGGGSGQTLARVNQIQQQMQQEVEKNSQESQRQQAELQRQIEQQMKEQQKEQEKLRQEQQKRLLEQEKQLQQQYKQQQQQLQNLYRN